jgi:hypothetical protein
MLVIDRFEGEYALIEYKRRIFHIPKALVPKGARPGDLVNIQVTVDEEATAQRKKSIGRLADQVFTE